MKTQLKTIRAGLEASTCYTMLGFDAHSVQTALAALDQIEKMAGAPVAWIRGSGIEMLKLENGGCATVYASEGMSNHSSPLYAAPVAQQYEAGDVASAAAQGFRDGVASVTQQEPVAWAMPKGDGTFIDVITPAEHARDEGSYTVPLFAAPVAQQQEPDLTSLLFAVEQAVKNGHCPWEIEAAFHEYEAARRAAPVAQQPQAEAVLGMYEHKCPSVTGHRGPSFVCQKAGHAVGQNSYCNECPAAPQQAEAVPSDVVCEKDPMGCWNVRCQLGKVCKNAAMKQGNQP